MRGIAGIIRFDQAPVAPAEISQLIQTIAICPTDRVETWCEDSAGLAHLIKFIQPEDRFEAQPLRSADGNLVLVTDAIVENRADLAREFGLPAEVVAILPDSAFVLRAYEKWGADSPCHLEGRFAFAVWHVHEQRLFCAVDHFSFRPFYYHRTAGRFAFASTLRGLLSLPGVGREIDDDVLGDFLCRSGRSPGQTLYREIKSLPAAHRLWAGAGRDDCTRYWQPDATAELKLGSDAEYQEAFRFELDRAISAGLRAEDGVGVMLSGGLDSSAVAAVAGDMLAKHGQRLQAFHELPPQRDPRRGPLRVQDESRYVRLLQAHAPHIDFHFIPPVTHRPISLERTEALFDTHCVPLGRFASEPDPMARAGFPRVARMLYGLAGNYTVSLEAYPSAYFGELAVRGSWMRLARELRGHRRVYGRSLKHLIYARIWRSLVPPRRTPGWREAMFPFLNEDFIRRTDLARRVSSQHGRIWSPENFNVRRSLAATMTNLMPQTVGVVGSVIQPEAWGDAHSPYFSQRLNTFCLGVPLDQQIRHGHDRLLLRQAMQGLLPEEVAGRVTRGFPTPHAWGVAERLQRQLPGILDAIEASPRASAYFNLSRLREIAGGESHSIRALGPTHFSRLASAALFLGWLDRSRTN